MEITGGENSASCSRENKKGLQIFRSRVGERVKKGKAQGCFWVIERGPVTSGLEKREGEEKRGDAAQLTSQSMDGEGKSYPIRGEKKK